jgi:hypothetical protein
VVFFAAHPPGDGEDEKTKKRETSYDGQYISCEFPDRGENLSPLFHRNIRINAIAPIHVVSPADEPPAAHEKKIA